MAKNVHIFLLALHIFFELSSFKRKHASTAVAPPSEYPLNLAVYPHIQFKILKSII